MCNEKYIRRCHPLRQKRYRDNFFVLIIALQWTPLLLTHLNFQWQYKNNAKLPSLETVYIVIYYKTTLLNYWIIMYFENYYSLFIGICRRTG